MKKTNCSRFVMTGLVLLWMTLIFYFSGCNAQRSSGQSAAVLQGIRLLLTRLGLCPADGTASESLMTDGILRKLAHFFEYTVLGVLLWSTVRLYPMPQKWAAPVSALVGLVYATSDELHQYFVPGRACRLTDVLIDFGGVVCGLAAFWLVRAVWRATGQKTGHVAD